MKKEQEIIFYSDELNDEFSKAVISPKKIDENYKYEGGPLRPLARLFFYHILARPIGFLFLKIKYGHKIVNKQVLKETKGKGYFMYGNHTNAASDPFIPSILRLISSVYVIVHPNNVSMPVFGHVTPSLGALPLPDTGTAAKNFSKVVKKLCDKGKCIMIYPEAHIWPYYTGIRPFKNTSFGYPIQCNAPVYCFTNTYQKRKFIKTPRIVTYIDGPYYADESLPKGKQKEILRDQVYNAMVARSKNSNVELIKYVKKDQGLSSND